MTCVIGLIENGRVYIGADSQAATGWDKQTVAHPKVFKTDRFLIGYTSSFRMGQLLQYQLIVRSQPEIGSDYFYMVGTFVESVRVCLKKYGMAKVENNQEEGGQFMVGYKGGLYEVQSDMAVLEYTDDFSAIGLGRAYALAAMAALHNLPAPERIRRSLEIASEYCNGISEPFIILSHE